MKKRKESSVVLWIALLLELAGIGVIAHTAATQGLGRFNWKDIAMAGLLLFLLYVIYVQVRIHRAGRMIVEEKVKTHTLVESLPQAVVLVGAEGEIIHANEAACRILAMDGVESIGKGFATVVDGAAELRPGKHEVLWRGRKLRFTVAPLRGESGSLVIVEEPESAGRSSALDLPKPNRERTDLAELMRRSLERSGAAAKGLKTEVQAQGDATASVDRAQVLRAFDEIVTNAVRYSKQGAIRAALEGGTRDVTVQVTDSGIGIPSSEFGRVFDAGFTGSNQLPETKDGLGLGLALAKRVIESHGGSIMIESRVGQGTRITLNIPRA